MADLQIETDLEQKEKDSLAKIDFKMVTFTLAGRDYGIDIMSIREIQKGSRFTYIPNSPAYVRGVYNLRGEIISVVDLRKFFSLQQDVDNEQQDELSLKKKALEQEILALQQQRSLLLNTEKSGLDEQTDTPKMSAEETEQVTMDAALLAKKQAKEILKETTKTEDILIARLENTTLGIIVDSIDKVVGVDSATIQAAHPLFADVNIRYIRGIVEKDDRLYLILDIERIFGDNTEEEEESDEQDQAQSEPPAPAVQLPPVVQEALPASPPAVEQPVASVEAAVVKKVINLPPTEATLLAQPNIEDLMSELNTERHEPPVTQTQSATEDTTAGSEPIENIDGELLEQRLNEEFKFRVSQLNEKWFAERITEYKTEEVSLDLADKERLQEFLSTFYSRYTAELWDEDLTQEAMTMIPIKESGILHIWDVGCGKGYEAYSLSIIAQQLSDQQKVKVYAQDKDFLAISMAPGLTFDPNEVPERFRPYLTESNQFSNEIKNTIMFEYHDVSNNHSLPGLDLLVMRDVLSFTGEDVQDKIFTELNELAKPGLLLILGDNEEFDDPSWQRLTDSTLSVYKKV